MFEFKRGDTVRICLLQYDKHGPDAKPISVDEQYGIVLEVDKTKQCVGAKAVGEIKVRRDSDGSLFDVDIYGQRHSFGENGQQFIQVQKCFLPVSSYKGTLVEWLEFIAHPSEHEDCIKMTVLGVVDGKTFHQESENHFMESKIHVDLSKTRHY